MGWFSRKKDLEELPPVRTDDHVLSRPPKPKGFQVGDCVVVVRFPNDPEDEVSEFEEVYGRIGYIAEIIRTHEDSMYDYTVRFPGWEHGWDSDSSGSAGEHWGVYHKHLRRVVSKHGLKHDQ